MPGQTSDELLALFDSAPLNRRYWVSFTLLSALFVLEFFDFLVVGYLLAVLGPQWHLTYGQSALILYSGGIGSILGALVFGGLADAWGRKSQMIIGTFICAIAAGLIGLVPSGSWQIFAILRFFVGVGLTGGGDPVADDPRRADPDPAPDPADELLYRFRVRRRLARLDDLGGIAGGARLARRGHARGDAGLRRRSDLDFRARIGALARGQGALCRGARRGRKASRPAAALGAVADRGARRPSRAANCPSFTITRGCSGRPS